jgi:hypothetical protein
VLDWYGGFGDRPPVYLLQGERAARQALAAALRRQYDVEARMPALGEELLLG